MFLLMHMPNYDLSDILIMQKMSSRPAAGNQLVPSVRIYIQKVHISNVKVTFQIGHF